MGMVDKSIAYTVPKTLILAKNTFSVMTLVILV